MAELCVQVMPIPDTAQLWEQPLGSSSRKGTKSLCIKWWFFSLGITGGSHPWQAYYDCELTVHFPMDTGLLGQNQNRQSIKNQRKSVGAEHSDTHICLSRSDLMSDALTGEWKSNINCWWAKAAHFCVQGAQPQHWDLYKCPFFPDWVGNGLS